MKQVFITVPFSFRVGDDDGDDRILEKLINMMEMAVKDPQNLLFDEWVDGDQTKWVEEL